ncbi:DUF3300 domain-containing protein [Paraburkholderia sartisoli]|uniref:DUF3300 domain-containing protein n=1 Tax=Paraburkholderia sartisoli TaxID=83784 RepID=A0A1H4AK20_9BURK|nr:DUF3300 domain-containing protein [Paraburkholderia sartisoli]SEA36323.1 Protein of unknown function [Paraburkholderia sartisoli]
MKLSGAHHRRVLVLCATLAGAPMLAGLAPTAAHAQTQAPPAAKLSNQQLDSLTAPIALYPDALLAQVLMASTYPQDVNAAAAWSKANSKLSGDAAVTAVASQPWDPSVQSLVAFPQVLATMASKPDWVTQLGNAFLAQSSDVMDSVQRLRKQAQQAGNLKSSEQQKVVVEQNTIQIQPASPQVVYVPTYNPTVVYGAWPYPAYPPVYVPPPPGYAVATGLAAGLAFGAGVAITNSLWGGFNWNNHDVNINVNRYNNINVNNRINANSSTANWNHNVNRNTNNLNRTQNNLGGVNQAQRDQFRGRDNSRDQARQTLQARTGQNVNGPASQRVQDIHQGGNAGARNGANAGTRPGANGGGVSNNDLRNRAQNTNRDNALRGAGDGNGARQDAQRGQASRDALASRSGGGGGGLGANGGGQQRAGGGLGANGGGQRSGGGGGLRGGGGGGGHIGRHR